MPSWKPSSSSPKWCKSEALADTECKLPLSTTMFKGSFEMMEVEDDLGLDDLDACGTS